jgi:DUF1680 family protein
LHLFLERQKENELSKLQISKQIQDNEIIEQRLRKEKELDIELSIKRHDILKEIQCELEEEKKKINAIPYYTWANRGKNEMQVWLPTTIKNIKIND